MGREDDRVATIVISLLAAAVLAGFLASASGDPALADSRGGGEIEFAVELRVGGVAVEPSAVREGDRVEWGLSVVNRSDDVLRGVVVQLAGTETACDGQRVGPDAVIECSAVGTWEDGPGTVEALVSAWTDQGVVGHRDVISVGPRAADPGLEDSG